MEVQDTNSDDLSGANQRSFKKGHSKSTLTAKIQSLITHALDDDEFVLLASLDFSSEFHLVNNELLLKRMKVIALPKDVIDLRSVCYNNRSFCVSIDGQNSVIFDLLQGTVQGSILGPMIYTTFVSPLF